MSADPQKIQYFNTEYPCDLFQDNNPTPPCKIFLGKADGECILTTEESQGEVVSPKENLLLNKLTNDPLPNENKYGNLLQQYYSFVQNRGNDMSILSQTPFYVQKMDRILMTMLFIFLDQGHDFHVALERGNTTWTGVIGDTVTIVYKAPSSELIQKIDPAGFEIMTSEEPLIPEGILIDTTEDDVDDTYDKETTSKSDFDEEESNMSLSSEKVNVEPLVESELISELFIDINQLYARLGVKTHNVSVQKDTDEIPPTDQDHQLTIKFPYKNEYRHFAINTSFSGDPGVFGVMFIDHVEGLNIEDIVVNVTTIIRPLIKYKITRNKRQPVYKIRITGVNDYGITRRSVIEGKTIEVTILPFVGGSIYNHGMHRIWEFNKKRHVFIINLDELTITQKPEKSSNGLFQYTITPNYSCKLLFTSDLIIPEREVDLNFLTQEEPYKLKNTNVKKQEKIDQYEQIYTEFKRRLLTSIDKSPETALKILRGTKYQIKNLPIQDLVLEYVFQYLIQRFYQEYQPNIDPMFQPFGSVECTKLGITGMLDSLKTPIDTASISRDQDTQDGSHSFILKQVGFVNDTSVTPSDNYYYNAFTNHLDGQGNPADPAAKISRAPYKFTVVSGSVDGSKQGGQITPEYHPPELDVYMVIFDPRNGELRGIVARITFIKKILGNVLNTKNSAMIDLHYVYVDVNFLQNREFTRQYLLIVDNYPKIIQELLDYALTHTFVKEDINDHLSNFVLEIPGSVSGGTGNNTSSKREWYKFTIYDNGPSVSDINELVARLTEGAKLISEIKDQTNEEEINEKIMKIENREKNKNLLFFILGSDDIELKYAILRVGQHLYGKTPELQEYFSPNLYDFPMFKYNEEEQKMNRNLTFERVFIIRNKYIGDKSRSTDCLFMNKSQYLECMQLSNDTNTLYTAQMFGLSTLWSTGGRSPLIYMAPYFTSEGKMPLLTNAYEKLLLDGMSSSVNVHKLNRKKEAKEGKGGINESAIIFEKRSRTPSSILADTIIQKKIKSSASVSSVDTPNYITSVEDIEPLKVEELKRQLLLLGVTNPKGNKGQLKKQLEEILTKKLEQKAQEAQEAQEAQKAQEAQEAQITPKTEIQALKEAKLLENVRLLKQAKKLPPRPKGGAVTNTLPLSVSVPEETTRKSSLIEIEPQDKKEIVLPENVKENVLIESVNEGLAEGKSTEQIYAEAHRSNLLYALKNNLEKIVKIDEKYREFIFDKNGKLELQNFKIKTDTQFFVANGLLSIRHSLISYLNSDEDLVSILKSVNSETTLDDAISIKNRFQMFFDEYNSVNNIDLHGIKYYFDNTDILFEDPHETSIEGEQYGGTRRYYAELYYCWQKNNNFILTYIKKYILPGIPYNIREKINNNIHIADNLYKFLTSVEVKKLIFLKKQESNVFKQYFKTYEYICFFYICFCNFIYKLLHSSLDISTLIYDNIEYITDESQLRISDDRVSYQSPQEDTSQVEIYEHDENLTSELAREAKNYYTCDDIFKFLNIRKLPFIFDEFQSSSNFSENNKNLFNIIIEKFDKSNYKNALLFLFYLFYPDTLKQGLIKYKVSLNIRLSTLRHFNSTILEKITEGITIQNIEMNPLDYIKEYVQEYCYFYNYRQYYEVFIQFLLINTGQVETIFDEQYIQNVTNQLYDNNEFIEKKTILEGSKRFEKNVIKSLTNFILQEQDISTEEEIEKEEKQIEEGNPIEITSVKKSDKGLLFCGLNGCLLVGFADSKLVSSGGETKKNKISKKLHKTINNKKSIKKQSRKIIFVKQVRKSKRKKQ